MVDTLVAKTRAWEEEHNMSFFCVCGKAMVDTLVAKTRAWEEEHNMSFAYDGVPLLAMLDEYEREDEKRRLRVKFITSTLYKVNMTCNKPMFCLNKQEQKKVQEQPHVEQDTAFSTRPSPARPVSAKKPVGARASNGGANGTPNRRLSLNANQNGSMSVAKEGGRSVCNFTRNDIKALQIQFMLTKKPNPFRIGQANGEKCGLQYAYLMHRIL
ncbi:hypothetical protein YC2023_071193 [Brassica napus]